VGEPLQQTLRRRFEVIIGTPFTEGNALTVLRNGDEIFPAMLDAIRGAMSTVDLMTFVYWRGDIAVEFARAMSERARAGIRDQPRSRGLGYVYKSQAQRR
jgi:cardiolipin synthase